MHVLCVYNTEYVVSDALCALCAFCNAGDCGLSYTCCVFTKQKMKCLSRCARCVHFATLEIVVCQVVHVLCVYSTGVDLTDALCVVCLCVSDKEWSEWYNSDRPVYGQGVDDETLQRISLVSIVTIIYLTCHRQWVQVGLPFCLPVVLTRYVTGDSSSLPVCHHYHHHHHYYYQQ